METNQKKKTEKLRHQHRLVALPVALAPDLELVGDGAGPAAALAPAAPRLLDDEGVGVSVLADGAGARAAAVLADVVGGAAAGDVLDEGGSGRWGVVVGFGEAHALSGRGR